MKRSARIACIADLHGNLPNQEVHHDTNIIIVAGDIAGHTHQPGTTVDSLSQIDWMIHTFFPWVKAQTTEVVAIAGNHDFWAEDLGYKHHLSQYAPDNFIWLYNSSVTVNGLKIWGSPMTPHFFGWAYNFSSDPYKYEQDASALWYMIPDDTNILITHGPPFGIHDHTSMHRCGCWQLKSRIKDLADLKLHVFGHIHDSSGKFFDSETGVTYVNASMAENNSHLLHPDRPIRYASV